MIIENIKNLIIRNKIEKNSSFYSNLRKLDSNITTEEAYEIILRVNPKKTKLIKAKDDKEFLKFLKINSYEMMATVPELYGSVTYYKNAIENIIYIRKDGFAELGEYYTKMNGEVINIEPRMDSNKSFIIIREKPNTDVLTCGKEYEVIVYMP